MMAEDIDWGQKRAGGHITAAAVAAVVSIVLHAVGIFYMGDLRLCIVPENIPAFQDKVYEALRVMNVMQLPEGQIEMIEESVKDEMFKITSSENNEIVPPPIDEAKIAPPAEGIEMAAALGAMEEPSAVPYREEWRPRQEVLEIDDKVAADQSAVIPRRVTPKIERIPDAPDYVASVDTAKIGESGIDSAGLQVQRPGAFIIDKTAVDFSDAATVQGLDSGMAPGETEALFEESLTEITNVKPIEQYLVARTTVYESLTDFRYGYFKIEIMSAGSSVLPVLSKDILFVQDSSASITERRLHFCREGLKQCISMVGPEDRFNIISFSDNSVKCFPEWQRKTPDSIEKAKEFISKMSSSGNTDIYASLMDALKMERSQGRPVIAYVVTDGVANTGITKSSNIIGEFSGKNNGAISVFMMGTTKVANRYLLDLMSYSNKGGVIDVEGGRWGISEAMLAGVKGVSRPVMSDVKFRFTAGSTTEVYPLMASNLYMDRPMVIYGRYLKKTESLVFQAVGDAKNARCDMIFDVRLGKSAVGGEKDIRTDWAKQKIYHLICEYTRNPHPEILKQIKTTARIYNVDIPHEGRF